MSAPGSAQASGAVQDQAVEGRDQPPSFRRQLGAAAASSARLGDKGGARQEIVDRRRRVKPKSAATWSGVITGDYHGINRNE